MVIEEDKQKSEVQTMEKTSKEKPSSNVFEKKETVSEQKPENKPNEQSRLEKSSVGLSSQPSVQSAGVSEGDIKAHERIEKRLAAIENSIHASSYSKEAINEIKASVERLEKQIDVMATQIDETIEEESLAISKLPNKFTLFAVSLLSSIITIVVLVLALATLPVLYPDLPEQLTGIERN